MAETEYNRNQPLQIDIQTNGTQPLTKVDYYVNNEYIGTSTSAPFSYTFTPNDVTTLTTDSTIRAIATDSVFNRIETNKIFSITE